MLPPGGGRPLPRRRRPLVFLAHSWGLLALLAGGLFTFPSTAGHDPYHAHIVVGGTPAARARALARHLLREREGTDNGEPPAAPGVVGGVMFPGVRVISIRGTDSGGPAVLSVQGSGTAALAGIPQIPAPVRAWRVVTHRSSRVLETSVPAPDPPPRRVRGYNL